MPPFDPLFTSPHWQTIAGHLWPRDGGERRFPLRSRLYRTAPDAQVLVTSQHPDGKPRAHLVLVHGLEGSGAAGYVRGLSGAALRRGFAAHRFHLRTCGGTAHLCRTLYHAGLTGDLAEVLRQFQQEGRAPVVLVGFSLGGNVVLKLAGEWAAEAPRWIRAVCAASTPLDLAACAERIGRRDNFLYQRRFVRHMKRRLRQTGRYRQADFSGLRTLFDIDDRITAPSFGFGRAAQYYATQSCGRFLSRIEVPALLVTARDDTFVPFEIYRTPALRQNPHLHLVAPDHGGHLGFLSRRPPRFWLDEMLLDWIEGLV